MGELPARGRQLAPSLQGAGSYRCPRLELWKPACLTDGLMGWAVGWRGCLGLESGDTGLRFGTGVKVIHRCAHLCEPKSCPILVPKC